MSLMNMAQALNNALKVKEAGDIAKNCLAMLARFSESALRITDKVPHNFEVLGLAVLLFPNARIIHCRRSPLDTCVSRRSSSYEPTSSSSPARES